MGRKKTIQVRKQPAFSRVVVDGALDLRLVQMKYHDVTLKGYPADLNKIETTTHNGTLMLSIKGGQSFNSMPRVMVSLPVLNSLVVNGNGSVTAKGLRSSMVDLSIKTNKHVALSGQLGLRRLTVNGKGSVNIKGIKSQDLQVRMLGKPKIVLRGMAGLRQLNFKGQGKLDLHWVKSNDLTIKGYDKGQISLAGAVNHLHMQLYDQAVMDGRYLRVKTAYVKTFDEAEAKISVTKHQQTLASGQSNIYFYNKPEFEVAHMAELGSVLSLVP